MKYAVEIVKNKTMKKNLIFFIVTLLSFSVFAQDQKKNILDKTLPSVFLKNLEGKTINTATLNNDGKPMIISFWATWCTPCKKELNTINDLYVDWQDETGVKLIAVSVDDGRTVNRVMPYVNAHAWEYEVLLDQNGDLKRAMGVNNVPFTVVIDGNGVVRYTHNNYAPGDEYELYDELVKLTKENSASTDAEKTSTSEEAKSDNSSKDSKKKKEKEDKKD